MLFPHKILFIRHGETDYNVTQRLQGQRDIQLNDNGRRQAMAVGAMLREKCFAEVMALEAAKQFYCSPLVRARETLELARVVLGLDPLSYNLAPDLVELSFGQWEGFLWEDVERANPGTSLRRGQDKWDFLPPGGESYATLAKRVTPWLEAQDGDRFVASHGGVARAFLTLLAGMSPDDAATYEIKQGVALRFAHGGFEWVEE